MTDIDGIIIEQLPDGRWKVFARSNPKSFATVTTQATAIALANEMVRMADRLLPKT